MNELTKMTIDLVGKRCPVTITKVNRALKGAEKGQRFTILTDDVETINDLAALCLSREYTLRLDQDGKDSVRVYTIIV